MLRFGKFLGRGPAAALGAGTAAAPTTSNCRAQTTTHRANWGNRTDQEVPRTTLAVTQSAQTEQEWLVTDVHKDGVIFAPGEVSEVINTIMGVTPREADTSDLAIHEVAQEGDMTDSDESTGADANEFMAAAGQEVARVHSQRDSFIAALTNLVNEPNVQAAMLRAMKDDPAVQALLQDRNLVGRDNPILLPPSAYAALADLSEEDESKAGEGGEHAIKQIAERVAAKLVSVGEQIRDAAANFLIDLGCEIHALLRRPFAKDAEATEGASSRPVWVPKLLMTVGCAVITLLVFKRLRIVAL